MAEYLNHELIVIAAVITLIAAWLKLMRQQGDPRLIAACGLLAYFLPVAGPLAALVILNAYDRRMQVTHAAVRGNRRNRMMYTRARQHAG